MSADVDQLLRDASREPSAPLDPEALWVAGRRRRRRRQLGAVATGAAAVALVAAVSIGLAAPGSPVIEPVAPPPEEPDEVTDEAPEEDVPDPEPTDEPTTEPDDTTEEAADDSEIEPPEVEEPAPAEIDAPEPDPAAVADPCGPHAGREGEAFIDVVAPIGGQHVDGPIELVGCSNVYEATVRYRVIDAAGDVVTDSFTTAECGNGCVGEFRDLIDVAPGEVTLQVFWDSPADGSEQDLVEIDVVVVVERSG